MKGQVAARASILHLSSFRLHPLVSARVAQLTERWSYKPEVEGLSPSLGTKNSRQEAGAGSRRPGFTCRLPTAPVS